MHIRGSLILVIGRRGFESITLRWYKAKTFRMKQISEMKEIGGLDVHDDRNILKLKRIFCNVLKVTN
jgi:hypothetical protein